MSVSIHIASELVNLVPGLPLLPMTDFEERERVLAYPSRDIARFISQESRQRTAGTAGGLRLALET